MHESTIPFSLCKIAADAENAVIIGNVGEKTGKGIYISASISNLRIADNVISHTTPDDTTQYAPDGIIVDNACENVVIENNTLVNIRRQGIVFYANNSNRVRIRNNTIRGQGVSTSIGIYVRNIGTQDADGIELSGNVVSNFGASAGSQGVVRIDTLTAGLGFTNFVLRDNLIDGGGNGNRALFTHPTSNNCVKSGIFERNTIVGNCEFSHTGVTYGPNRITGGYITGVPTNRWPLTDTRLRHTEIWHLTPITTGSTLTKVVTVAGAAVGDRVHATHHMALAAGTFIIGTVTAANEVTLTFLNFSGGNSPSLNSYVSVDVFKA